MKRLELESLLADRSAALEILQGIPQDDPVGRLAFESRIGEIDERLQALEQQSEHGGSVALVFSGAPVTGSRSIDATFASEALGHFQEMLKRRVAAEEAGEPLGSRGPIPLRTKSGLGISSMVRGSVGFLLEEQEVNASLADTVLKHAIDDVTAIVEKVGSENVASFDEAVEAIDGRLLDSMKGFFHTLDESGARVRIIEPDRRADLDMAAIRRARERLDLTEILEQDNVEVIGELLGILPDPPARFSMMLDGGVQIRGGVAARVANSYREQIELSGDENPVGKWWRARMKVKEVLGPNRPTRTYHTLLRLLERVERPSPDRRSR